MALQRLNRGMMARYEIEDRRPDRARAVQFGADETLLGTVNRLLEAAAPGLGIACVAAGEDAKRLSGQDGMYTLLVRGYEGEAGETPVRREIVIQRILEAVDPEADFEAFRALSLRDGIDLALVNTEAADAPVALTLAARLLAERWRAGLGGLAFLCAGETADCARRAAAFLRAAAAPWGLGAGFDRWLEDANEFHPMLADSLAFRASPEESAKLCADMNYADGLVHVAEPFARLTIGAPASLGARLGLDAPGIVFAEDIAPAMELRHRVYDGALALLAAPGWLLGCETLSDAMKHERLRAFAGGALYRELLPALPVDRARGAAAVIETFGRFENPLNDNRLLAASRPLLTRVERGLLPAIRALAAENFEAPAGLSFALAATIMLYAGVREADGRWEVARGSETELLRDNPDRLRVFASLSHDMPPEALAYAALADRELWHGEDLREIDGLEYRVALDLAALQRDPGYLPGEAE